MSLTKKIISTLIVISGLLIVIILNPILTYANETGYGNFAVFHNLALEKETFLRVKEVTRLLKTSEFYNRNLKLDICLNDGSLYPKLIQKIRGRAFAFGFYKEIVLQGNAHFSQNYVELNGYRWNLTQLLVHEAIHCLQFDKLGVWKTNPVAHIPEWKFEGYPEYVARQDADQTDLAKNIDRLIEIEKHESNNWISFEDGTGTVIPYYKSWLLIQYCMQIKQMTYQQILADTTAEDIIRKEMMNWHAVLGVKH